MTNKKTQYYLIAAISITVFTITWLLRRQIFPERFNDKIDDMTETGTTESLIYNAALQRLLRKFNATQADRLAKLMVAQSKYETFYQSKPYNSHAFLQNNNAFGYKRFPGSAYQTGAGITSSEGDAYASYNNVQDSAREVADWLGRGVEAFSQVSTPQQYAQALKTGRPGYAYYGQSVNDYGVGVNKFYTV